MPDRVVVIIPAFNEAENIAKVVQALPQAHVQGVYVVDNGSTDGTAAAAQAAGATVVTEPQRGYGYACLAGIAAAEQDPLPDIVVFLDGDFSDYPEQITRLLIPVQTQGMDMVIGSRVLGQRESGSLTPQQRFGNWLATALMRLLYRARYTDLGPFRAIRYPALKSLGMVDKTYGWTVEMQLKAAKKKLKFCEVPVDYRRRHAGVSKVSGSLTGSIKAGFKIIGWIFRYL